MQTIRVLVADDTADTRDNVRRLLHLTGGFEIVAEAADGRAAMEKALELRPDCVLMDVSMPVMDGLAAAKGLARQLPWMAIVMMSVLGERETLRQAVAAGAHDYLIKPFEAKELTAAIRRSVFTVRQSYL